MYIRIFLFGNPEKLSGVVEEMGLNYKVNKHTLYIPYKLGANKQFYKSIYSYIYKSIYLSIYPSQYL